MNTKIRILLAAYVLLLGAASTSPALAWGCAAASAEGSYGYSNGYDNESDAAERALTECANRTTTSGTCEIAECNQDW